VKNESFAIIRSFALKTSYRGGRLPRARSSPARLLVVCTEKLDPDIMVMKSTQDWTRCDEIGSAAGRINGVFGEADWTPIRYVNRPYSHSTLAGLYRAARVGLVTPLRDGMNLVAKEYVASQNPDNPGVLILSRFASASHESKAALLVNPYDPDSVAAAIGQALAMPPAERRQRHDALFRVLSHNDIQHWADSLSDRAGTEADGFKPARANAACGTVMYRRPLRPRPTKGNEAIPFRGTLSPLGPRGIASILRLLAQIAGPD
jgi:hypothetical protein